MTSQANTVPQEPFTRISVTRAKEMYDQGDSVVVDVRQLDEWQTGHVVGAVHIPVDDVLARVDELPTDKDLLFICAAGIRSALACEMAAAMGRPPERLFNVEEGMVGWEENKFHTSHGNDS